MSDQVWFPVVVMDFLMATGFLVIGYVFGRPEDYVVSLLFLAFALLYPENSWGSTDCLLLKIVRVMRGVLRGELEG